MSCKFIETLIKVVNKRTGLESADEMGRCLKLGKCQRRGEYLRLFINIKNLGQSTVVASNMLFV